ncbi:glucose-1-phosphate thymidylyltransferase [Streptomyces platensis]|uniref:glucose-1-phosphate thymidylyltransferase n=1 Tax=Streptomyces platensis TaxID=58346 RepID=UPI002E149689|nr:glucose-1-phosphate thymidylyltransferase [Streptomyces platensis]WSI54557.1 glucose-1-phosphate thymidylyltransferase [Streptomyces platensis]WTI55455.1 glucose-1-phosphate thymidylyltransferase [Streptomyces platensis]WUB78964.1 glucose-1-phosphate thymidylyltransferase [Streptomyces platensis]
MKALVLAGGSGTRLRPITHTSAKQLVPVANKPVLFYGLEAIAAAGITEVGMIVGDTVGEISESVGDGSKFGLDISYIEQREPLGLAHAVLISRDYLGNDDFTMYLGDNFIVGGIEEPIRTFRRNRPDAHLLLTHVSDPQSYGVADLDASGRVRSLEEKPKRPKSDLALVGVYLFSPAIHEAVRAIKPSWRGELEITDAVQWLIDAGKDVRSTQITGYWKDTGNVTDMLEVNRLVLETIESRCDGHVDEHSALVGRVRVEEGAVVRNSRVVGPAVIGAGSAVTDSYVGPFTSIGEDCVVEDSEVEFSIVLRSASLSGVRRVEASLIGRHVQVTPAPPVPHAHRLVLGDHSTAQISS